MARNERLIKIAIDKLTGGLVQASELFDGSKVDSFAVRREFQSNNLSWRCCECGQDLIVSTSSRDRLYFKHKFPHNFCILSDGNLSPIEQELFSNILATKESDRHKELKNKIGKLLKNAPGVDSTSVSVDEKFIIKQDGKRKPDVYCRYLDKELVFEIQLSKLSLRYILNRYDFYRKNGMYLIWVLDNFDIHNQGTLDRDIKYLTEYQNFFKLDESAKDFRLQCDYKFSFITEDDYVFTKWLRKSVALDELKFDDIIFQSYYYNYSLHKLQAENDLKKRTKEKDLLKKKNAEEKAKAIAEEKAEKIITTIKSIKSRDLDYTDLRCEINALNKFEIGILNSKLNLKCRERDGMPILQYWIKNSTQTYDYFLQFLLSCKEIELKVTNEHETSLSLFQQVLVNKKLYSDIIIKLLLKRGYEISEKDIELYQQTEGTDLDRLILYRMCSWLRDKSLVDDVFKHYQLLYTIQSAAEKKIVGYRFDNWVALANNAIQHHSKYWEYLEMAFKKFKVYDLIIQSDKKGTFQKKLNSLHDNMPEQNHDFVDVLRDLYPELEYL